MRRPLIVVALLYVAGILLATIPVSLGALFAVSFTLAALFPLWKSPRRVVLASLIVLAGWINLAERTAILSPNDLRDISNRQEELVAVRGVLSESPTRRVHKIKERESWRTMARLDVNAVNINQHGWQPGSGRITCGTPGYLPEDFFGGQTVEISGVLQKTRGPIAEGLFDYRKFLEQQGIYYELEADRISDWKIISSPQSAPLGDRFCAWARKAIALGMPEIDLNVQLEWALTLDWKAALTDEVTEPFMDASTYHIFAVDGLRIAIVSGILLALLRTARVPRAWCGLIILPVIWFYAAMTGWPASAMRAIAMITIVFGGWILRRPTDLLNSLFAAALVILVWEPRELFQSGFQFSFFVVLCLILILPTFEKFREWLLRPDPLLPESLQSRWRTALATPARFVLDLFFVSLAAWLGSIPLTALYFHLVTPVSGPANVLAVPLCTLVLICNFTSILLAGWLPAVAILCNHAGWFFMGCIRGTSEWFARQPGAYFHVSMPTLFGIALYYFILIGGVTGWLFRGTQRKRKLTATVCLVGMWGVLWINNYNTTRLTALPLEGGHAIFLKGGGHEWLINCGGEYSAQNVTKPFLEAQGVNWLSHFVLTHGESEYNGGASLIYNLFRPQNIHTSAIHFRSPQYQAFQRDQRSSLERRTIVEAGQRLGEWEVLYPAASSELTKADDNAMILRGEFSGTRVLLLADLSHAGQNALLSSTNDLRADIIVAGLPVEGEPLENALLDAIQPRLIVIADSRSPANKRAGDKLRERLLRRQIPVVYTSDSDAVTLEFHRNGWVLKASASARAL